MVLSKYINLIDLSDFSVDWWLKVVSLGAKIADDPKAYRKACDGKIMATLFYEPSTRTQMRLRDCRSL